MQDRTELELERIGSAAGLVWQNLRSRGPLSMAKLTTTTGLPRELVLCGLGWLAREGKLQFLQQGRNRAIGLIETECRCADAA